MLHSFHHADARRPRGPLEISLLLLLLLPSALVGLWIGRVRLRAPGATFPVDLERASPEGGGHGDVVLPDSKDAMSKWPAMQAMSRGVCPSYSSRLYIGCLNQSFEWVPERSGICIG